MELYRATVERTIRGKRGQAFLLELATVMDAMTKKVLIAEELVDGEGQCCAIGSVCRERGIETDGVDVDDSRRIGELVGISRTLAAEIEYVNDEAGSRDESPEKRWQRVRQWVGEQLVSS